MRKLVRIIGGFSLVIIGSILALPFVPGPGLALVVLGFVILSEHFAFARKLVDWGKTKLEGIPAIKDKMNRGKSKQTESSATPTG